MQNLNNKILTTSIALNTLAYIINSDQTNYINLTVDDIIKNLTVKKIIKYENICLPS